ncbi:helix-turn-helix transcriptional regulator [Subdoligranulum sp. DSM 109015]|uniref:Helix-turn-helix transcriptional regulator n=1 Tax=Gemmiger gallinarum TaxID=2779354 RepID=A0ABR9R1U9_9FIRM|nr:AraC family transcriptional regulator [Gemmiger gallinarum]MBE5037099.1 helix-turn-helix transcriptional regulator [Gemmiger gallinarum]
MDQDALFSDAGSVRSRRILYTPSPFARANLVHLQETGRLTATAAHTSRRERLQSFLCFVVCAGSGQLVYDGQHFPLKAGDVVFLDCRRPYAHSTGGSAGELWTLQWCHFYGPCVAAIYEKYCERGGRPVFHPADAGRFSELMSQVYAAAGNDDYIRDMWLNEKLNTLLALLMAESWQPASLRNPRRPARRDVAPVREYLEEHCTEKIALESVAEHFFLNKHYLARLFKEQYGVSVNSYLTQVRITRAKQMLRFTDKAVSVIAAECGLEDANYFSRVFKKVEGVTPKQYRELW